MFENKTLAKFWKLFKRSAVLFLQWLLYTSDEFLCICGVPVNWEMEKKNEKKRKETERKKTKRKQGEKQRKETKKTKRKKTKTK